ncbi:hypothetical protein Tco_0342850 [Tanacetum coccineum]
MAPLYASRTKAYPARTVKPLRVKLTHSVKLSLATSSRSVDPSHCHGMIGTLLYLTASRPGLQFVLYACVPGSAYFEKHLHTVKRIFWHLKGTVNRGLWYPKNSSIALTTFADADHAGCQDTHRSTYGSM